MPINREFLQLQFDTKQYSVLRKKYPRKKHTSGLPTLHGHGKQSKELGENPSVLFVKHRQIADPDPQPQNTGSDQGIHCLLILTERSIKMLPNNP